ncbi:biotin transporter BioY [Pengzhenrongella sp.]|jgi:biotin transport system substrate-specific component|uniref:biotin transporter BioY n=1 Tax=Pengzhenrongella sp. TaxID=2888820 RepID=UPI002F944A8D
MQPLHENEPTAALSTPGAVGANAGTTRTSTRAGTTTDVALVATFAALIAVCAMLPSMAVAGMAVPITLQTFGVMLAGVVLGARRGALAVLLYLAVGFAGLPVFAQGTGGLAVLAGPSAGYLIAFPLAAALAGYLAGFAARVRPALRALVLFGAATAGNLIFTHPIGIAVMGWRLGLPAGDAIKLGATFLPGDVIKNVLVAVVAAAVFRAFPDMLRRRR